MSSGKKVNDALSELREEELKKSRNSKNKNKKAVSDLLKTSAADELEDEPTFVEKFKRGIGLDQGIPHFLLSRVTPVIITAIIVGFVTYTLGYDSAKETYQIPEIKSIEKEITLSEEIDNLRKDELNAMQAQLGALSASAMSGYEKDQKELMLAASSSNQAASKKVNDVFDQLFALKDLSAQSIEILKTNLEGKVASAWFEKNIQPQLNNLPGIKNNTEALKTTNVTLSLLSVNEYNLRNYTASCFYTMNGKQYMLISLISLNDNDQICDLYIEGSIEVDQTVKDASTYIKDTANFDPANINRSK